MGKEQNPRRKAIDGARRDRARGHQTRRARRGKKQKRRQERARHYDSETTEYRSFTNSKIARRSFSWVTVHLSSASQLSSVASK